MKRKIVWMAVSCLMVLSLVLASCGPAAPEEEEEVIVPEEEEEEVVVEEEEEEEEVVVPAAEEPKYGGTISLCYNQTVSSPNPMQIGPTTQHLNSFSYDCPGVADWTRGPAGTGELSFMSEVYIYPFVGALAESWEQPDPYTYVFHLRQGIHWQNKPPVSGRELTAQDVVDSKEYLFSHTEIKQAVNPQEIDSITALDKYTVEVKTNAMNALFLQSFMVGDVAWIFPVEMEKTYGEGWTTVDGVCGTGPFIMTDFVSNSSAAFERNPDYWAYDELNPENQLPYADGIKYFMITDKSTYTAALRTGKIDAMWGFTIEDADSLKITNPELKWASYLTSLTSNLDMRVDKEPYSDIRVRKALNMAIDREAIVRDYLKGQGEIFAYPLIRDWKDVYIPLEELPESTREQFEYNPEKARQLLADAGYPDGFQCEVIVGTGTATEKMQILAAYLREIGVDCEMQVLEGAALLNMTWGKKFPHMALVAHAIMPPITAMEWKTTGAMFNIEMYSDPEFDQQFQELIVTLDETEQNRMIKEMTLRYLSAVPMIMFPTEHMYSFWCPWLKNYHGELTLGIQNRGGIFARAWVDQEMKKAMGY